MQLKFNKQSSLKESLLKKLVKILFIFVIMIIAIFLIDKINFPSPKDEIKKNITDEIIKLK
ncbi:MAG: hypothetical protein ACJZ4O_03575 [Pelagibacteraceae bacterium]